jgi:hypothetical protein
MTFLQTITIRNQLKVKGLSPGNGGVPPGKDNEIVNKEREPGFLRRIIFLEMDPLPVLSTISTRTTDGTLQKVP